MAVLQSDLVYYLSSNANSAGGAISVTPVTDNTLDNVFADTPSATALSGGSDYRKIFLKNNNGVTTLTNANLWRSQDTLSSDDEVWLGVGTSSDDDGSVELIAIQVASLVSVVSTAADTRVVTLVGENAAGSRVTETVTLNGTTPVNSTNTYSKLYNASVATTNTNIVTVKQNTNALTLGTIPANKLSAILYQNLNSVNTPVKLGNLASGASAAIWLKRITQSGANLYNSNSCGITVQGST